MKTIEVFNPTKAEITSAIEKVKKAGGEVILQSMKKSEKTGKKVSA